jgi:hypothetical protein
LASSNLQPGILAYDGKRPDYRVTVDGIRMTVEVKRPGSLPAAEESIEEGARQIDAARVPGFVVLDICDLVAAQLAGGGDESDARSSAEDALTYSARARPVFRGFANHLFEHVERYVGTRPRDVTCRVIGLITYSRHSVWSGSDPATLDFGVLIQGNQLKTPTAVIYRHAADRMFQRLEHGVGKLTGNSFQRL